MKKSTAIDIDLAKNVIQVCVINKQGKVISNKAMSPSKLKIFLSNTLSSDVAFEGASTCHSWGRFCKQLSHDVRIIGPRKVKAFLQGQKTDANDALAIAVTPKQYSSGGKVSMKGIDKIGGNKTLRANLFMGARAVIKALPEKPRTTKEKWLIALKERVGEKRACIALANKTVRTALAILMSEEDYKRASIPV